MPILKTPLIQPKNETIQLRVPQELKFRLTRYAEFIHATTSYVVIEMLERLFRKDVEFQEYLAAYKPPEAIHLNSEEKTQRLPSEVAKGLAQVAPQVPRYEIPQESFQPAPNLRFTNPPQKEPQS